MKKIIGFTVAATMLMAAVPVLAASFTNVEFQNGDVVVQGQGGSTVTAKFRVVVPINQVVEKIQTDVIGDNLAPVCTDVGGEKGLEEGTHEVSIMVKLPPNTGTYNLDVQGSGIYGAFKTVDCTSNVVGSNSFGGALKVATNGSSDTVGGSDKPSWLDAMIAAIIAAVKPTTPPAPVTPAACVTLAGRLSGAMYDVTNAANGTLQGFLIGEGFSIPLLQANQAPFGFWGVQTNAALMAYKAAKGCN